MSDATGHGTPVGVDPPPFKLALAMTGGGARAAYQVGLLRWIAARCPDLCFPILTGVSAGAINTAFLASHTGSLREAADDLTDLWKDLTTDQVFESGTFSLLRTASRWGLRLVSGGSRLAPPTRGMVDTAPLRRLLRRELDAKDGLLTGVAHNLEHGRLEAVGLITSNYATGQSITYVQSNGAPMWRRPHRRSMEAALTVEHVMASAALPLFFPAVELDGGWHGDGGIRLTAPLAPALHLGADRILAISTRVSRRHREPLPVVEGYPPPAQVLGNLISAVFLDNLDFDALNLARVNMLLERIPEEERMGLRKAELLIVRPSQDLSSLASEYEPRLPQPFKFLTRGLGTRETKSPDSLSMVMFEPDFLRHIMELGESDAERNGHELMAFLAGDNSRSVQQTGFWRL